MKKVTDGKGVNVAVEVTGNGKALDQVLDCMARFGRVSLLGCTRNSDFTIDYYRKIHFPGITLVGAHTAARPDRESAPGYWCYDDDLYAIFKLLKGGCSPAALSSRTPHKAQSIRLSRSKKERKKAFPCGKAFFVWENGGKRRRVIQLSCARSALYETRCVSRRFSSSAEHRRFSIPLTEGGKNIRSRTIAAGDRRRPTVAPAPAPPQNLIRRRWRQTST